MPSIDIDPAALSRPASSMTPILPSKSIGANGATSQKPSRKDQWPERINLEPLYMALKGAIGDNWTLYKESISLFVMGM